MNSYSVFHFVSGKPIALQLMRMYCLHQRKCFALKKKNYFWVQPLHFVTVRYAGDICSSLAASVRVCAY